jgi:hypothetical protein
VTRTECGCCEQGLGATEVGRHLARGDGDAADGAPQAFALTRRGVEGEQCVTRRVGREPRCLRREALLDFVRLRLVTRRQCEEGPDQQRFGRRFDAPLEHGHHVAERSRGIFQFEALRQGDRCRAFARNGA